MTIYIDFDQTLNVGPYPKFTEPVPGSIETVKELIRNRHELVLNTYRVHVDQMGKCFEWLEKHGISSMKPSRVKLDPMSYLKSIKNLTGRNTMFLNNSNAFSLYIDDMAKGIHTKEHNGINLVDWSRVREDLVNIGLIVPIDREKHPMSTVYVAPGYMNMVGEEEKKEIYEQQQKDIESGENSDISS